MRRRELERLNKSIAEKVLGWKLSSNCIWYDGVHPTEFRGCFDATLATASHIYFTPFTNIAHAWMALEHIQNTPAYSSLRARLVFNDVLRMSVEDAAYEISRLCLRYNFARWNPTEIKSVCPMCHG